MAIHESRRLSRGRRSTFIAACFVAHLFSGTARAQSLPATDPAIAISFDAAASRLDSVSHALSGAGHEVKAADDTADALKTLHRPVVTVSAQYLEYQKTLSLDLSGAKSDVTSATDSFLGDLPTQFPSAFQQIVGEVVGRVQQALPGLLSALPNSLSYQYRDDVFRPTIQAVMPLYTGGAIPAIQRGAQAGTDMARARQAEARDLSTVNLVRVYFGQQVAIKLLASGTDVRDAFDRHLSDTRRLEQQGIVPHATTLEVQVARDAAERSRLRAELDARTASDELGRLLDADAGVTPTTPLFVDAGPLPPVGDFLGGSDLPRAREADAARELADAGTALAKSRFLPQAYAFGEYNFDHKQALPTEPDWVVGVGVRYTLLSNIDRRKTLDAAREHARAAADAAADARKTLTTETIRAYDLVETARQSFLLLDSDIAAAQENLRVQQISFREGEANGAAVTDAIAALQAAETQRIATAYEYDLALAGLLAASGRLPEFSDYLARADYRLAPHHP
ncbi:TolC family protein [Sphingomonas abietis]|uniref:TolC family protein n=1 Tax=Sphingomonas abietis TaxID=3012344 RepID=A0ABY7NRU2_9SPHN|nr:TolC family protein [Sphingomonas abietis]WBO24266.1 TolC family protein [Sphingomonas abietis]